MQTAFSLLLFALALAGLAAVAFGVRLLVADWRLSQRISGNAGPRTGETKFFDPIHVRLPGLFRARGKDRAEIERKLKSAGYFEANAIDIFLWLRLGATIAAVLLAMLFSTIVFGTPFYHWLLIFAPGGLAYIGMKYALLMRAAERERRLTIEFPFLLDLMLMMLESGVSLDQCFRAIARDEKVAVPRHAKLVAMLVDDLDRGQDYQAAFDRWATRVGVSGARELASLFRQSLFQGMELVPAMREFIIEFTQRRVMRAREAIGTITVRMVILMLVFFMPALFIVLAAPPITAIFDTLRGGA